MGVRYSLQDVEFGNPIYALATMTAWELDAAGAKTTVKATLYSGPTGAALATNPQTLDSEGKLSSPVYIEDPVILTMSGIAGVDDHDSGIISVPGQDRGQWQTATVYYPGDYLQAAEDADSSGDLVLVHQFHTSGDYATDIADGKIAVFIDLTTIAEKFGLLDPSGQANNFAVVDAAGMNWTIITPPDLLAAIGAASSPHNHDGDYLQPDVTANLSVGFTTDISDTGNSGSGDWTPGLAVEHLKTSTVNGSFTLVAPTGGNGWCIVEFTNDGTGPHSPSFAAYQIVSGTWDDTNGAVNLLQIVKIGSNNYLAISQPS